MLTSIKTERLIVRPFTLADTKVIFQLSQEKDLGEWIPDQVYETEKEAKEVLEFLISKYSDKPKPDKEPFVLAVVLAETNKVIGHVGLSPYEENKDAEIGYAIAENQCGNGFASEAVSAVSGWALKNLEIAKIYEIVACGNKGSYRVLEKSKFDLEEELEMVYLGKLRNCRKYSLAH